MDVFSFVTAKLRELRDYKKKRYLLVIVLFASPWIYKQLMNRYYMSTFYRQRRKRHESFAQHYELAQQREEKEKMSSKFPADREKVGINKKFWERFRVIMKILIPHWRTKEMGMLIMHSFFLVLRTWLSVVVARIDGRIVKDLVAANGKEFLVGLAYWFLIAIPATYTNSMIRYLQSKLAIAFRTRLTQHFQNLYLKDMVYYKLLNLDSRIEGPDQLICTDIARFSDTLASLYSNLAKPVLDTVIFNYQLTKSIGPQGMIGIFINYVFTAWLLRQVTPSFGKMAAVEAKLEGDLRTAHSRIITNGEEIAFYQGDSRELGILDKTYRTLMRHVNRIYRLRIAYNMFEDFIIKYSWSAAGLIVCSVPVFFPAFAGEKSASHTAHGSRTQGFITNKRLMISLADAGGRIMYSYKEMTELAGHTFRVYGLLSVFEDLKQNIFQRSETTENLLNRKHEYSIQNIKGQVVLGNNGVQFENVPVVTPSGEVLIRDLSFEVKPGMHLLITGANGVGKSCIMRIIAQLWPLFDGKIKRPFNEAIIFIPQRPYLSIGTLRDQVIYPDSHEDMIRDGRTESELFEILEKVHLEYLVEREGGWDTQKEWKDVFSGGEKQRMNLARLFYHKPQFAVLDECTSAVSTDVEGLMYQRAKDLEITLITISHRPSLFKYHRYLLKIDNQKWEWQEIGSKNVIKSVHAEIRDLENKIEEETKLIQRIKEVNAQLGVNVNAIKK